MTRQPTPHRTDPKPGSVRLPAHVMVIDDDSINRKLLRYVLEVGGYQVEEAVDGQDARTRIQRGSSPDLCIVDLMMPRLDGLAFPQKLRLNQQRTKVITCSASNESADLAQARNLGTVGHLTKPLFAYETLSLVNSILGVVRE